MGFNPILGDFVEARERFLAGSDKNRAKDLMDMFKNPKIKAIFCARGGYGVNRVLGLLKPRVIRDNPKIVVGSSDLTLFLWYLNDKCSISAFHGPMVAASFGNRSMPKSQKQLQALLTGKASACRLKANSAEIICSGNATGVLTGGCLSLLCRSLRTRYEIRTQKKILILEDVNEPPYRIDGMLWQLRQAGKFKGVRGVIFGEMVNCHPSKKEGYLLQEVIEDFFRNDEFPVMMNCPVGHGEEIWTLPFGIEASLNTRKRSLLISENGVV